MRIVTWNMDHWRRSQDLRDRAWRYLSEELHPDVALLQESVPRGDADKVVFREGGILDERKRPPRKLEWGSSVVSFGPPMRAMDEVVGLFSKQTIPLHRTFPGAVAIAEVDCPSGPLVVVSAYGLIDRGYADTTVHRILSDLTPLIDLRKGRRMVIAGDLNITTQWSKKHRSFLKGLHEECLRRDKNVFARFEALGFRNVVNAPDGKPLEGCECTAGAECRHVQTQRHDRSTFPWQNDYFFVTEGLVDAVVGVEVLAKDEVWHLSGHSPIIVELNA